MPETSRAVHYPAIEEPSIGLPRQVDREDRLTSTGITGRGHDMRTSLFVSIPPTNSAKVAGLDSFDTKFPPPLTSTE